jgi:hypothetical protein
MPEPFTSDAVAESYVELTVAIVTMQGQIEILGEQVRALGRHHVAIGRHLDALHAVQVEQVALLRTLVRIVEDRR